jgi:hypothetical protein
VIQKSCAEAYQICNQSIKETNQNYRNLSQSQQFISKFHHLKFKTRGQAEKREVEVKQRERKEDNGGRW